jgi:hypothetical protein
LETVLIYFPSSRQYIIWIIKLILILQMKTVETVKGISLSLISPGLNPGVNLSRAATLRHCCEGSKT